ncbi:MAG: alanine racemase [Opitutaceae bacterium]|nr:alanine racemase [Opitutaceae bacterium]
MNKPSQLPLRCWAEIDLACLERNIALIKQSLPPGIRYVAVVKADAYGHGIHQSVARLMHSKTDLFAVANISEAAAIRELGPGWPILLLSPLLPDEDKYLIDYDLIPTISSEDEVQRFNRLGDKLGKKISVHMKIDTGMGRAGVWHSAAPMLHEKICQSNNLSLEGIYTHFSSSDSDIKYTKKQRDLFLRLLESFKISSQNELLIHTDNSSGIESFNKESPVNAVRIGLLQYGILPYRESILSAVKTESVFSFHTRIGLIKKLPIKTPISYGRTFTLKRDSTIAVLTAGYADGIPRLLANRGSVIINGRRCPILGNITMDQTIIDITDLEQASVGDPVTLFGKRDKNEIGIAEFSQWAETIPWEVLTSISKRVRRIYKTDLGV